ncbi:uncharacterized protein IWZ02DRAFT_437836 [Phyllosticta citriasiana]|uniref:uncharacterized protein n=1 Tax=Phyllosticta citriasiana TaxID=595635 RepID=UPI0030FDE9F7
MSGGQNHPHDPLLLRLHLYLSSFAACPYLGFCCPHGLHLDADFSPSVLMARDCDINIQERTACLLSVLPAIPVQYAIYDSSQPWRQSHLLTDLCVLFCKIHTSRAAFVAMLRCRATEIRLTAQDIEDGSKRLAARRAAGNTRSAPCKIAPPENPGPRLRRGPERSRDESIVHPGALHGPQECTLEHSQQKIPRPTPKVSAKPERAQRTISPNDGSSEDDSICTSDLERLSTHPTRSRTAEEAAPPTKLHRWRSWSWRIPLGNSMSSAQLGARHSSTPCRQADPNSSTKPCRPAPKLEILPRPESPELTSQGLVKPKSRQLPATESAHACPPKSSTETRDSVAQRDLDLSAPDHAASGSGDPIPIIRLPSNSSTLHSSDSERRRHSLPAVANVSPFGTLSRSPSVSQISEHSSRNASIGSSFLFRNTSTPDLLRPLLGVPSVGSSSSRHASAVPSRESSPTLSATMLDLINRETSPLDCLEKETRSQMACAPCSMSRVSPRASQDTRRPLFELRMPTFESPERMSPPPRRVPRHRHSPSPRRPMPTFAEIPHSNFSSLDVLPSFSFDSSPPQPSGGFIERYPTAGSRTLRTLSPHLTTASMPSLQPPPERHSRRRASGNAHVQVARVHAHGRTIQQSWSPAVDSAASTAMAVATAAAAHAAAAATESRRNTMDIHQHRRPQRLRSVSARLLPPWQDEQENSGRAERQAMMAEIEARRRYVEQTNDGRIDRTPPSLGTFERRVFQQ